MHLRFVTSFLCVSVVATGCGSDEPAPATSAGTVILSGDAIPFSQGPDGRIADAQITIVEAPDRGVTTGPDGHFSFNELKPGSEVTLRMIASGFPRIQTGTITLPPEGASRVTFQAVSDGEYIGLAIVTSTDPNPERCQVVTTVTRIGRSIYEAGAHGEADVTVAIDPPLAADLGPIYFNSQVRPDRALVRTSDDGGVLYVNVPPGTYTLTGTKAGATFTTVKVKCEAGWLVNASPPWGLQRLQ